MDQTTYLQSLFSLEGKTILVTGAAGGIGTAISRGLARAGGQVALCGRTLEKCRSLAQEIQAEGGKASAHLLDVMDMATIQPLRGRSGPAVRQNRCAVQHCGHQ